MAYYSEQLLGDMQGNTTDFCQTAIKQNQVSLKLHAFMIIMQRLFFFLICRKSRLHLNVGWCPELVGHHPVSLPN